MPYSEADVLGLMDTFENKLYKPHSQHFDTFCIDMGWSDPHTFWDINTKLFPRKFAALQAAAVKTNSSLGLWISPSNFYTPECMDSEWAKDQGYETFTHPWLAGTTVRLCCLGGTRSGSGIRDRLVEMVTKHGVRHIKFDGYSPQCPESDHGHEPAIIPPTLSPTGSLPCSVRSGGQRPIRGWKRRVWAGTRARGGCST